MQPQPNQEQTKIELLPIDKSKSFGVLMKDGIDLLLTDNWMVTVPFHIDDYDKCNCFIAPDLKFADGVGELRRAVLSWAAKKNFNVLPAIKDSLIKVSAPRAKGIVKDIKVEKLADNSFNLVEWEKVRSITAKKAVVKVNCYYQNRDDGITVGFFYQLVKLLV
jgi:hypothetical protein